MGILTDRQHTSHAADLNKEEACCTEKQIYGSLQWGLREVKCTKNGIVRQNYQLPETLGGDMT